MEGALSYRPLDRPRNEIRLLRILPPADDVFTQPNLAFSPDPIECVLEYESLDHMPRRPEAGHEPLSFPPGEAREYYLRLLQGDATISSLNSAFDADGAFEDALSKSRAQGHCGNAEIAAYLSASYKLQKLQDVWKRWNGDPNPNIDCSIPDGRLAALLRAYDEWVQQREAWVPREVKLFGSNANAVFERWVKSWVWAPLSGHDKCPQNTSSAGYFALSYVWNNVPSPFVPQYGHEILAMQRARASGLDPDDPKRAQLEPQPDAPRRPLRCAPIYINGYRVLVGENLESALRAMREIPEIRCGKRVWVDSLCINQNDLEEKAHEVGRMADIYMAATKVISYLGRDEDKCGHVLEVLNGLGESALLFSQEVNARNCDLVVGDNIKKSELIRYLWTLLRLPYWYRAWVVQELFHADETGILICGARKFLTANILRGAGLLIMAPTSLVRADDRLVLHGPRGDRMPLVLIIRGLRRLGLLQTFSAQKRHLLSLKDLAHHWFEIPSSSEVTDPRDLFYSLLAMLPSELRSNITINYAPGWTLRHVMTDFAAAHMRTNQSLSWILLRPQVPFPGLAKWPSWVPNLALGDYEPSTMWYTSLTAGVDERVDSELDIDVLDGRLTCQALHLDTIRGSSTDALSQQVQNNAHFTPTSGGLEAAFGEEQYRILFGGQQIVNSLRGLPEDDDTDFAAPPLSEGMESHNYADSEGLRAAVARCFKVLGLSTQEDATTIFDVSDDAFERASEDFDIAYKAHSSQFYSDEPPQSFLAPSSPSGAIRILKGLVTQCGNLDFWGFTLKDFFAMSSPSPPRTKKRPVLITDYFVPLSASLSQKSRKSPTVLHSTSGWAIGRLFTTRFGLVGAAQCRTRQGDEIFYLPGCSMPVVLRPSRGQDGCYKLVGGVYLDGLMVPDLRPVLKSSGAEVMNITLV